MIENRASKHRGRPVTDSSRDIPDKIMDVTEKLLQRYDYYDLSSKIIASESDVDEAMIRYYFGNKDGLILAVIDRYYDEVSTRLEALENLDLKATTITYDIIRILIDAHHSKPWITRLIISELTRTRSPIKEKYLTRAGDRGKTLCKLQRILERLVDREIYTPNTDIIYTTLSIVSQVSAPIILSEFYGGIANLDDDKKQRWARHLADLFDHKLRPDLFPGKDSPPSTCSGKINTAQ